MKKLERNLSLVSVVAISVGGMLGSGIFVLPGLAAAKTGSSVWLAYLMAALCILPAALSKSELATAMPSSGGTYLYIERSFGPLLGTISGIGLWLSLLLKSSFALMGFGAYLLVIVNMPLNVTKYVAIAFLFLIGLLNIFGVKKVGKVQIYIVSMSLIGLIVLLFFGLPSINEDLLNPFLIEGNIGLVSTVAFVFVSYAGVTKVAAIAGEIKNPDKNLPRAMIIALILVTFIYVLVTYTLVGNIPLSELSSDIKPIHSLAFHLGGKYLGFAAATLGVITLVSMANSGVLAASRFPFAMAKDKLLPPNMSRLHEKHLTPVVTIIMTCVIMAMVILFLDVEKIAKLASAFMVLMFIFVNASVIVLRETAVQWYNPSYKSPFYPIMQLFGIISGIILLLNLGLMPIVAIFVIFLIGLTIYFYYGKDNAMRSGVLSNYGHKPAMQLFFKKHEFNSQPFDENSYGFNKSLDGNLIIKAEVLVPLFGDENSPETLVEMGAAMSMEGRIQSALIKEVPDQTHLDAVVKDSPTVSSLDRRLSALEKERNLTIDFESIVTHELTNTLQSLVFQTDCKWLIMGWDGREHDGIFIRNPLGWLVAHIDANLALFKDKGIRRFKKVLLAARPDSPTLDVLIRVANRICTFYGAQLTVLHVLPTSCSNEKLISFKKSTNEKLSSCIANCSLEILQSDTAIDTIALETAKYDLLVIGTTQIGTWYKILFNAKKDRYTEKSACSVLRITTKEIL